MRTVKTAISIDKTLFENIDRAAHTMSIPRSRFFAMAAREYLNRHENHWALKRLNEAYAEGRDSELVERMREAHRRQVEGQW